MRLFKLRDSKNVDVIKLRKLTVALSVLSVALVSTHVKAFNIGEAKVNSFIGQNLSVFVPIFNDGIPLDINQVRVSTATNDQKASLGIPEVNRRGPQISYQTIGNQTRQGILITSSTPINEPYVNLAFQVNYQGSARLKALPILLDLPGRQPTVSIPLAGNSNVSSSGQQYATEYSNDGVAIAQTFPAESVGQTNFSSSTDTSSRGTAEYVPYGSDIMGPYDWAQEGLIPEKFGPVIDGQSLWRVARRINKAMGVSVDQMMWALYKANPSAFSTKSVTSLRSGETLAIPSESFVREVSELQALRLLNENTSQPSVHSSVSNSGNQTTGQTSIEDEEPVDGQVELDGRGSNIEKNPEFGISAVDSTIIDTLTTTVSDLTQQLLEKDTEIETLKGQIEAIKAVYPDAELILANANSSGEQGQYIGNELGGGIEDPVKGVIPPEVKGLPNNPELDQIVDPIEPEPFTIDPNEAVEDSIEVDNEIPSESTNPIVNLEKEKELFKELNVNAETGSTFRLWPWILGGLLVLLGGLLYFFLDTVKGFFRSLFGREDEIVLNIPSVIDSPNAGSVSATSRMPTVPVVEESNTEELSEDDDLNFDDDDFLLGDGDVDIEEVNLSDRIKELLNAGDFTAARKTVEFAEEASIDPNYLDFCRLKIFAAEEDKSEFAKVFNRVNRRINDFHPDIQHRIAELHREMFDSETVIDFGFKED